VKASDSVEQYGVEFANSGFPAGKKCVSLSIAGTDKSQGISDGVINAWDDNSICVPWESKLELAWVEQKPTTSRYVAWRGVAGCNAAQRRAAQGSAGQRRASSECNP
jgi:hypothetical protein